MGREKGAVIRLTLILYMATSKKTLDYMMMPDTRKECSIQEHIRKLKCFLTRSGSKKESLRRCERRRRMMWWVGCLRNKRHFKTIQSTKISSRWSRIYWEIFLKIQFPFSRSHRERVCTFSGRWMNRCLKKIESCFGWEHLGQRTNFHFFTTKTTIKNF